MTSIGRVYYAEVLAYLWAGTASFRMSLTREKGGFPGKGSSCKTESWGDKRRSSLFGGHVVSPLLFESWITYSLRWIALGMFELEMTRRQTSFAEHRNGMFSSIFSMLNEGCGISKAMPSFPCLN